MKVLVATEKPFAAAAVKGIREIVEQAGLEFALLEKYSSPSELIAAVADATALIVRSDKVTAEVIAAAPSLKIVVRAGAGYDNLDLEACSKAGVVAMNTPGQNSNAVAELAIAMMIYMSRGQFTPATGSEIQGKTLGIQAFGNVGRLVGSKAAALGMKVRALDPFMTAEQIQAAGAESVEDIKELYSGSDFVSIHIPATPQTIGSIGRELICSMPKGAVLVNTARKEVIEVCLRCGAGQLCAAQGEVRAEGVCDAQEDGGTDGRSEHQRGACGGPPDSLLPKRRLHTLPAQQIRKTGPPARFSCF